jgi:hypothetical protein
MMRRRLMLVLALLPLSVAGTQAQPLDAKISIHVSDTLENALRLLREKHSLLVSAEGQLHQRFLDLDVDEAAPRDVIIAICKALGGVYDQNAPSMTASGARPHDPCSWSLRVGEWDSDPRPQATVADYTVYVEALAQYHSDSIGFRWGMEAPEVRAIARASIRLWVEPHTAGAPARLLAGF